MSLKVPKKYGEENKKEGERREKKPFFTWVWDKPRQCSSGFFLGFNSEKSEMRVSDSSSPPQQSRKRGKKRGIPSPPLPKWLVAPFL